MKELNGILVVYKEKGYTSHDVVNIVRRLLGTRKVGHTGTLDPNAEGVLPVCVGKSTRLADMLTFSDKEYVARIKLGITTDTYDIWGKTLSESPVNVSRDEITAAVNHFTGEIMQIPPMYSALKINGKKLCDLARKGIEVERKPRSVTIYKSEILEINDDEFKLRVRCSKGTYIRSLCSDIGEYLGCGAAMTELLRTKSSVFGIDDALTVDEIKSKAEALGAESVLKQPDCVFMNYGQITVTDEVKARLLNGAVSAIVEQTVGRYRVYDRNGEFIGISEVFMSEKGNYCIKIIKAFYNG